MTPMNLRGIGYLGVEVPDVAAWAEFASGVVGLMPVDPPAGGAASVAAYFTSDDRQWRLAVHRGERARLAYAGFEVLDEPSFHQAVEHLQSQGAGPKPATEDELAERGVREMVHVQDPSGTRIEIFWGPVVTGRFCSPVGVPRFVTDHGSAHYVLLVSDLDASMDFYLRVLGMKLTDYCEIGPGMSVQFLRCTPRHHSVAFTAVGRIDGLHHVAFEVPDIDHVGMALERATRARIPITATLGRHKNDHMLSFYMRSPAGFEIEIGCGARLVDEATWVTNRFAEGDLWGHHGLTGDAMAKAVAEPAG